MTKQTNEAHDHQPDIEIYIKDITVDAIISWLNDVFEGVTESVEPQSALDKTSITLHCKHTDKAGNAITIPATIFTGAAGKLYTSLWLQSDKTPWETDLDCAIQYVEATGSEVRCSTNGWEEFEDTDNQWWVVTKEGKTIVNW